MSTIVQVKLTSAFRRANNHQAIMSKANRTSGESSLNRSALRQLAELQISVANCERCPRLVEYRQRIAQTKRRAYREWTYWGKPVPGFGDPRAELMIIGLAPGAHGSNRTGRMFTGDRSGDFLYNELYQAGFASHATSIRADDGLELRNAYISAVARCAPPDNKPLPIEIQNCAPYLEQELDLLRPRVVLALGAIAFENYLRILLRRGAIASRTAYRFAHGAKFRLPDSLPMLFASYHPSQQNTQTGRLTPAMFASVLRRIRRSLETGERK